jgi:uncharacterized membrane protein
MDRPNRPSKRRSKLGVPLDKNLARIFLEKLGEKLSKIGIAFLFAAGTALVTSFIKKAAAVSGGLKYGFWWTVCLLATIVAVVLLILLGVVYFYGLIGSFSGFVKDLQEDFPDRSEFAREHTDVKYSGDSDPDNNWDDLYG